MKTPEEIHLQEEAKVHQLVTGEDWEADRHFEDILNRNKLRDNYIKAYGFTFLSSNFLLSLQDFIDLDSFGSQ